MSEGKPGKPGQPPHGQSGGRGGEGGRGGKGKPPGAGGKGGEGGRGAQGEPGPRGDRGRMPRAIGLSYLALAIVTALVLSVGFYYIGQTRELAQKNVKATTALCAQRDDLDVRIAAATRRLARSQKFLREHPRGIPGIPVKLIRQGLAEDAAALANSRKTRRNLSILDC